MGAMNSSQNRYRMSCKPDGSIYASDFEDAKGHLYQYALKFSEDNWRLFEGRIPLEASDLAEQKFWQWCSIQPLSIWENE